MRGDIKAGARFSRPRAAYRTDDLRELQGHDPMIRTLVRDHYCPEEHQRQRGCAAGAPGGGPTFRSDSGCLVQLDLDVQEYARPDNDPLIPRSGPSDVRRSSFVDLTHHLPDANAESQPGWELSGPHVSARRGTAATGSPFDGWDKGAPADAVPL